MYGNGKTIFYTMPFSFYQFPPKHMLKLFEKSVNSNFLYFYFNKFA